MKKLVLFSILIFAISAITFAQQYGWQLIETPDISGTPDFSNVFFVNDNTGWITTDTRNNIFKTDDGAVSFTTQVTTHGIEAIQMFDINNGYAGGESGIVFNTTDGGLNWTAIGSIGVPLTDMDFATSSQGYACGDNGTVFSISGTSVTNLNCGSYSYFSGISAPSVDNVWVCGGNRIYYYNGTSFTSQPSPGGNFNDIHCINNQEGWVVGDEGIIYHTSDGGAFWAPQTNPDTQDRSLYGVFFLDSNTGWAVGFHGIILHTTDGGTTWTIEGAGLTTAFLREVHFTSATNGYIVGNRKTLIKYTEITGIGDETEPLKFEIYPNPAQNKIQIHCSEFKTEKGIIEILSLEGKKILEKDIESGIEIIDLDLHNLKSGMYFCKLSTDKKSTTKKLIIE